ncbi:MAG: DUF3500 domain-containing protein [Caldilineaceae bacterium]
MPKLSRRNFLGLSAAGTGAILLGAAGCTNPLDPNGGANIAADVAAMQEMAQEAAAEVAAEAVIDESTLIANMTQAASNFVQTLDDAQLDQASYDFGDPERFRWHWTTPRGFPRNGLPLRQMNAEQKAAALALLQSSLSASGFQKALDIISLQQDLGNDPELYYVTLFGEPGGERWSWRWEGHHLSHHFAVLGERVAMTPFFLGSWPTKTEAGLRAMSVEEDAGLELINTLPDDLRQAAIFQNDTLTRHVTQNAAYVEPLAPVGVFYGDLPETHKPLVDQIVQTYLHSLPDMVAAPALERIAQADIMQVRFGWAGSLEQQRPQYYRLQGPTFLLEFDNSRNGGTHIHSVWRDFEKDFGVDLAV